MAGRGTASKRARSRHLDSFLEMLSAERGASLNTVEAYGRDLDDYEAFLRRSGQAPEGAEVEAIRRYLGRMAKAGLAPRTVQRRLSALRQFHRFLAAEGIRSDAQVTKSQINNESASRISNQQ
jgi:integrase/recombinase XerD